MKSSERITKEIFNKYKEIIFVGIILIFSFILFFAKINVPLFYPDVDESIYAQSAIETLEKENTFLPIWHGKPFFDKPPLGYFVIQAGYKLFGVNDFGARAGMALVGVLAMVVLYYLAKELFSSKNVAFISTLLFLATDSAYFHLFRSADLDSLFVFFLLCGLLWYVKSWKRNGFLLLVGVFLGLAAMTKGAAVTIPVAVFIVHWLSTRGWKYISWHSIVGAVVLFIGIVAPWHWWMIATHGPDFLNMYLGVHVVDRVSENIGTHTTGSFWYLEQMALYFWPLVWMIPVAVFVAFKSILSEQKKKAWLLIGLWAIVFVGLYSIVPTRLYWYISPIYPILSVGLAAVAVYAWRKKIWTKREIQIVTATFFVVMWTSPWWRSGILGNQQNAVIQLFLHPLVVGSIIGLVGVFVINKITRLHAPKTEEETYYIKSRIFLVGFGILVLGIIFSKILQLTVFYTFEPLTGLFEEMRQNSEIIVVYEKNYSTEMHGLYYYAQRASSTAPILVDSVSDLNNIQSHFCFLDVQGESLDQLPQDPSAYFIQPVGPYYVACWEAKETVVEE